LLESGTTQRAYVGHATIFGLEDSDRQNVQERSSSIQRFSKIIQPTALGEENSINTSKKKE
jgi:hypothetical protein